eukprot:3558653-Amphidinium_carterae.1
MGTFEEFCESLVECRRKAARAASMGEEIKLRGCSASSCSYACVGGGLSVSSWYGGVEQLNVVDELFVDWGLVVERLEHGIQT